MARHIRGDNRPFGGVKLIVTGDFLQLPPVCGKDEAAKFCFEVRFLRSAKSGWTYSNLFAGTKLALKLLSSRVRHGIVALKRPLCSNVFTDRMTLASWRCYRKFVSGSKRPSLRTYMENLPCNRSSCKSPITDVAMTSTRRWRRPRRTISRLRALFPHDFAPTQPMP